MTFFCLYISRWWRQTWDTPPYLTVVNQSEARISTEHGIKHYTELNTTEWQLKLCSDYELCGQLGVFFGLHYNNVIMGAIACQITSLTIVYSTDYSDADKRKHQSSASLAFLRGIHRGPVNSPHAQMAIDAENVSIWWRHHVLDKSVRYRACTVLKSALFYFVLSPRLNQSSRAAMKVLFITSWSTLVTVPWTKQRWTRVVSVILLRCLRLMLARPSWSPGLSGQR